MGQGAHVKENFKYIAWISKLNIYSMQLKTERFTASNKGNSQMGGEIHTARQ